MKKEIFTLLDFAEEFGKDKQLIRRTLLRLRIQAINKNSREYSNEPFKYDYQTYIKLSKELDFTNNITNDIGSNTCETRDDTQSNTHVTHNDTWMHTDNSNKDKIIEILERELEASKKRLEKSENEKENLIKLLDQQQQLTMISNGKLEILNLELEEKKKDVKIRRWWKIFSK